MFLVVVTLQLIAVGHGASVEVEKAFQEFMRTYDKRYDTDEQYQVAKDAFENTMREIETLRANIVMESRFKIELSQPRVVPFSVQQLVDCSTTYGNRGCDGGRAQEAFAYSKAEGIVKESSYPYMFEGGPCKESVIKNPQDQCIRPGDIVHLVSKPKANEEAMVEAVARGPVPCSFDSKLIALGTFHWKASKLRTQTLPLMAAK
ncbi:conserved hypothetical protein [Perkinsus marinus ATCC 50983]|uniref:Peptidase C1A papain C-terminal domain-containing protein n=1 Tax=Perkinsus marinus (strain ATCC 50983 / TXsc) TaxID=423536 RepID=C5LGP3_PERM5|nr:conserved hypothetical protein [Perkinsus marinus ATCC 50983]EER04088.1 conserved hypothetical protein [Perkinsus marinus ATCC 50983]|eukprot:XP_002772272.1 conserved hypothetical protein [Perkinsus marinus ATCC 50983]